MSIVRRHRCSDMHSRTSTCRSLYMAGGRAARLLACPKKLVVDQCPGAFCGVCAGPRAHIELTLRRVTKFESTEAEATHSAAVLAARGNLIRRLLSRVVPFDE